MAAVPEPGRSWAAISESECPLVTILAAAGRGGWRPLEVGEVRREGSGGPLLAPSCPTLRSYTQVTYHCH